MSIQIMQFQDLWPGQKVQANCLIRCVKENDAIFKKKKYSKNQNPTYSEIFISLGTWLIFPNMKLHVYMGTILTTVQTIRVLNSEWRVC